MAKTKGTFRRLNRPTFVAAPDERIGNKSITTENNLCLKLRLFYHKLNRLKLKKTANS